MRIRLLLIALLTAFALASAPAYGQSTPASRQIVDANETPDAYHITSAYPNPFNPQTQFTLKVTEEQRVRVEVYNLLGRRVQVLHDDRLTAGQTYTFTFEASNVPSGIYLIRVIGEAFITTQRVTLLK